MDSPRDRGESRGTYLRSRTPLASQFCQSSGELSQVQGGELEAAS